LRQSNSRDEEREATLRERARQEGPLRRRIVQIVRDAARDWGRAGEAIGRGFRGARELASFERRFAGDVVYEIVRHWRRLVQVAGGDAPERLLDAWLSGTVTGTGTIAVELSYPDWMADRLGPAEMEAMNRRAPLTVRANRVKCDREKLQERLKADGIESEPAKIARDGLVLLTRRNVYEMAAWREGWMELQDEGSQLIAELSAPPPRGTVIDACAGAGGKTLAIGALLANQGRITAFDVSEPKLEELRRRARRNGLTNVRAILVLGSPPKDGVGRDGGPPEGTAQVDRVLVDAPCTGVGVIRRNPETKWRLSEGDVEKMARKQRRILEAYAPLAKAGGRVIYATCSLFAEENDQVVDEFLKDYEEFESVPAKEILGRERALAMGDGERLRMSPALHGTDGFFAAVMRRRR
jgi:16S rRNA (cytosine967-C5)-methyltransferase